MMSDRIRLNDMEVNCVIGVNAPERTRPQRLLIRVELAVSTEASATADCVNQTVDYESIATQIQFVLQLGQFHLLETACHAICRTLLLDPVEGESRAAVQCAGIRIDKPEGLQGRAVPSVEIQRKRGDVHYASRVGPMGVSDVIVFESPHIGLYRPVIAPGSTVPLHLSRSSEHAEMLLSDELEIQGSVRNRGSIVFWPRCFPRKYRNASSQHQSLLRIARPPSSELESVDGDAPKAVSFEPNALNARAIEKLWPAPK